MLAQPLLRALAAGALLMLPGRAAAFTVLQTQEGVPLQWYEPTIQVAIGTLSDDLTEQAQLDVIDRAFGTWADVPGVSYEFEFTGFTDVDEDADDGVNTVFFMRDGWRHSESAVGITRSWARSSGAIHGFDLMLNDANFQFTATDDEEAISTDLENTLTHEIGHVLGLDHSHDPSACMYATAVRGETLKRTLGEDDISAVQWLYPADWFEDAESGAGMLGCDATGQGQGPGGLGALAALSLLVVRGRGRSRDAAR